MTDEHSLQLLAEQLRTSEVRYRHFMDLSEDSIWCLELDEAIPAGAAPEVCARLLMESAKFTEVNNAFKRHYGAKDAVGQRPADVKSFWMRVETSRMVEMAQARFDRQEMLLEEVDEQGRVRHFTCMFYGVEGDDGLVAVWGMERDVTVKFEEEQLLRESQEFYKAISETALDGICVLDGELELIDCNDAFAELCQTPREELLGSGTVALQPVVGIKDEHVPFRSFASLGRWRGEALLRQAHEGAELRVELACRVTGGSASQRYYCFIRDLSERRSAEKRESDHQRALAHVARLSTLGEMTSGIAHELNQPLAAIVNYANGCSRILAAQGYDDAQVQKGLDAIAEQGDRAAEIIRRMRSFARRESDKREPFHVSHVLSEAIELSLPDIHKAGIHIETDFGGTSDTVVVDGIQIEQVTLNLIRNSIDALTTTKPESSGASGWRGQIVVRTSVSGPATSKSRDPADEVPVVTVTVEDNGPGVTKAVAGRMFEPFFTAGGNGIGLGLTIGRSIVESHGGRLWFAPGEDGAAFHFTLPVRTAPITE